MLCGSLDAVTDVDLDAWVTEAHSHAGEVLLGHLGHININLCYVDLLQASKTAAHSRLHTHRV